MKIIVPEHLGKKDFDTLARQRLEIDIGRFQLIEIGYRDAADTLHDHDPRATVVPVHPGNVKVGRVFEVASEFAGVGGLAHQVEFVENRGFEFTHDLYRFNPPGLVPVAIGHLRQQQQYLDVLADLFFDAGTDDLDHHFFTLWQARGVDLGNRRRRDFGFFESAESLLQRHAQLLFDDFAGLLPGKGRNLVEQFFEFVGDFVTEQVAARGHHLAELDENRAQRFDTKPQPFGLAAVVATKPVERVNQAQQVKRAKKMHRQDDFVEAESRQREVYRDQAKQVGH